MQTSDAHPLHDHLSRSIVFHSWANNNVMAIPAPIIFIFATLLVSAPVVLSLDVPSLLSTLVSSVPSSQLLVGTPFLDSFHR